MIKELNTGSINSQVAVKFTGNEWKPKTKKRYSEVLVFILPGFLLAAVFIFYPMIKNIQLSFSEYDIVLGKMTFIGLDNYSALFQEAQGRFFLAYRNNLLYAVVVTPCTVFMGMVIAVLINSLKNHTVLFRTLFYLPVITSWIIAGIVFKYLFNPGSQGFFNYILFDLLHLIKEPVNWLKTEWGGNFAIWVLGIWKNIGYAMVLYLAALQMIDRSYYEASEIEGANSVHQFFKITIPLIKPTTFFLTIQMLIGSFNVFLQVLVLTGGDPRGKTSVLQYILYDRTFRLYRFGEGSAIGVITALSILLFTVILNRKLKTDY